jgi:carbon storage regulator CsrA
MLVLTRKPGETIHVGDAIITFMECEHGRTRVAIEAPRATVIDRGEVAARRAEQRYPFPPPLPGRE